MWHTNLILIWLQNNLINNPIDNDKINSKLKKITVDNDKNQHKIIINNDKHIKHK